MNTVGSLQALLRSILSIKPENSVAPDKPTRRESSAPSRPNILREAVAPTPERLKIRESFQVRVIERMADAKSGERVYKVILISEGLGNLRNKNYYGPEAIASSVKAFEGRWCYLNHQDEGEAKTLPERRVQDKAGFFMGLSEVDDKGKKACGGELHCDLSESGKWLGDKIDSALLYKKYFPTSESEYVGFSVNADGDAEPRTMQGVGPDGDDLEVNYVTAITEGDSCDLVTTPARGGRGLAVIKEDSSGAVTPTSQEDGMKKELKAIFAKFSEAIKSIGKDKAPATLTEAQKDLGKFIEAEADEVDEADAMKAMCAKKEDESEADHLARLKGMADTIKQHLPAPKEEESEDENEDEDEAEAMESKRDALAGLIKESGLPDGAYDKADLERLTKLPYREAKAIIAKDARLAKSIRESVGVSVASLHRGAHESDNDNTKAFCEAARKED